jgi:hypothetical protein
VAVITDHLSRILFCPYEWFLLPSSDIVSVYLSLDTMDYKSPSAVDNGIEAAEPYKSGFEKEAKDVTRETESAESPGSQPDKAEYVKGHPVIRNGKHSSAQLLAIG